MKLRQVLEAIPGLEVRGSVDLDVEIRRVSFDSRAVDSGTLFVALVGGAADGHAFVPKAREAGVAAVLAQRDRDVEDCLIVSDTRAALPLVAREVYGNPSAALRVVGVTGTNGKTTTSFLLEGLLDALGHRVGVLGTVNYRWPGHVAPAANTTPESSVIQELLRAMLQAGVDSAVMEVSSHGLATHRAEATLFDVVMFTNLTRDHLDFHGSMEAYRDAKLRLFDEHVRASIAAGKRPVAVVNVDDAQGRVFMARAEQAGAMVWACGRTADHAAQHFVSARNVSFLAGRTRLNVLVGVDGNVSEYACDVAVLGDFNVENLLGVVACAIALGESPEAVVAALPKLAPPPGRLEVARQRPLTFVDYAHTPDALERVLDTLRSATQGRIITVCGCGGDRDRQKRPQMAHAASSRSDVTILTSDNPRSEDPEAIIDDMLPGLAKPLVDTFPETVGVVRVSDRGRAIELAVTHAGPQDIVLIAGKGHENYQEISGVRRPFSDVEVARGVESP